MPKKNKMLVTRIAKKAMVLHIRRVYAEKKMRLFEEISDKIDAEEAKLIKALGF